MPILGNPGAARPALALVVALLAAGSARADGPADLSAYRAESGVAVRADGQRLELRWPIDRERRGRLLLDLGDARPLIAALGLDPADGQDGGTIIGDVDPAYFVTVGTRKGDPTRPPEMSEFNIFFDSPAQRPFETVRATLEGRTSRVFSQGRSTTVAIGPLKAGPFAGELQITIRPNCRLVHLEAVVKTEEPSRAFFYDAGLVGPGLADKSVAWVDTEGALRRDPWKADQADRPLAVRHRAIFLETDAGSLACFPPPHQFFFPRDLTDNLKTVWYGRGHRGLDDRPGFGVRQAETGGGNYSPWFSAPPGTEQRLGVFLLVAGGKAESALDEALRFTRKDRFPDLAGHITMTSHWHMAIAVAAMKEIAEGRSPRSTPDFVTMFKDMNVDIVHLGEFHGDGHPQDPGPLRLPELEAMFAECRRLSDDQLLMLPGEEANVYLAPARRETPPGHWMYLFPRPVRWIMKRQPDEPFVVDDPQLGKVYRVGNAEEMSRLLELENGLAWTAHARIKASNWTPDAYRERDFFKADTWLGAAWKAMPADLSRPKLGERILDLFDDMANWGGRKHVLGEVDVFKIDHTHELYGHMNINYLRLDRLPRFDDGWSPVLDALRNGRFFTTTGEILVPRFEVGGRESGAMLTLPADGRPELVARLQWTFPPRFAEIVSGDGAKVYRERIDLSGEDAFGEKTLVLRPELQGRHWVRFEAWDIAANGAFTQAIWLEPAKME